MQNILKTKKQICVVVFKKGDLSNAVSTLSALEAKLLLWCFFCPPGELIQGVRLGSVWAQCSLSVKAGPQVHGCHLLKRWATVLKPFVAKRKKRKVLHLTSLGPVWTPLSLSDAVILYCPNMDGSATARTGKDRGVWFLLLSSLPWNLWDGGAAKTCELGRVWCLDMAWSSKSLRGASGIYLTW